MAKKEVQIIEGVGVNGTTKEVTVNLAGLTSPNTPKVEMTAEDLEYDSAIFLASENNANISSADNQSATDTLYEDRKHYKRLINDLNYPRSGFTFKAETQEFDYDIGKTVPQVTNYLNAKFKDRSLVSVKMKFVPLYELKDGSKTNIKWEAIFKVKIVPKNIENQMDTWYKHPFYGRLEVNGFVGILRELQSSQWEKPMTSVGTANLTSIKNKLKYLNEDFIAVNKEVDHFKETYKKELEQRLKKIQSEKKWLDEPPKGYLFKVEWYDIQWPRKDFSKYNQINEIIPEVKAKLAETAKTKNWPDWRIVKLQEIKPSQFGDKYDIVAFLEFFVYETAEYEKEENEISKKIKEGPLQEIDYVALVEKSKSLMANISSLLEQSEVEISAEMPAFVGDAFNDFQLEYNSLQLSDNSKHLKKVEAKRGYEKIGDLQKEHVDHLYSEMYRSDLKFLKTSPKIKNIDDFYKILNNFLRRADIPLTRAGFIESGYSSILSTGLAIDIQEYTADDDEKKVSFYDDINYPIYKYLAKKYGFRVDPNIPWRLIADVRSIYMWKYLKKQYPEHFASFEWEKISSADIINKIFVPAFDYKTVVHSERGFVYNLIYLYNKFLNEDTFTSVDFSRLPTKVKGEAGEELLNYANPDVIKTVGAPHYNTFEKKDNVTRVVRNERKKIDLKQESLRIILGMSSKYAEWYAEVRNIERGNILNTRKMKMMKKQVRILYKHAGNIVSQKWANFFGGQTPKNDKLENITFGEEVLTGNMVIDLVEATLGSPNFKLDNEAKNMLTFGKKNSIMLLNTINRTNLL